MKDLCHAVAWLRALLWELWCAPGQKDRLCHDNCGIHQCNRISCTLSAVVSTSATGHAVLWQFCVHQCNRMAVLWQFCVHQCYRMAVLWQFCGHHCNRLAVLWQFCVHHCNRMAVLRWLWCAAGQAIPPFVIMKGIRQRVPTTEECLISLVCISLNPCTCHKICLNVPEHRAKFCFDMYMSYGWGSTGENVTSERYTTWRHICPTRDKISLHGSFTRMRILPRAYRNTITRIRFHASGYFSSSAIPLFLEFFPISREGIGTMFVSVCLCTADSVFET